WTKFSGHNLLSLVLKDQKLFLSLARRAPLIGESIPNKFSVCSSKGQALQLRHALDFLSIQPLRGVDGVSIEGEDESDRKTRVTDSARRHLLRSGFERPRERNRLSQPNRQARQ